MRMLATTLVLLLGGAITAAPPSLPPRVKNADLPKVIHTCRMIVIRGPAGPQMVPYPVPVPAPPPVLAAPSPPVIISPPAPIPPSGPDPATLALLHQILANQTTVLQHLAAIRATPAAPPCGGGSGVIVVPADGSPPAVVPVPVPTPTPGVTPSPAPPPFTLPPGAAPPFTLPPGSAPPITLPPGAAPPMTLPPGAAPPFTLPPGSAPPAKAAPTMPPADPISAAPPSPLPQRYTVYMRYTMYEPARRRYVYVFIPQPRPNIAPAVTETREKSTFTPASKKR